MEKAILGLWEINEGAWLVESPSELLCTILSAHPTLTELELLRVTARAAS